jgi:hypothetical protein
LEYIESLTDLHILDTNKSNYFKTRIDNIYGKQKESINGNNNIPSKDRGDEVLKRNLEHF